MMTLSYKHASNLYSFKMKSITEPWDLGIYHSQEGAEAWTPLERLTWGTLSHPPSQLLRPLHQQKHRKLKYKPQHSLHRNFFWQDCSYSSIDRKREKKCKWVLMKLGELGIAVRYGETRERTGIYWREQRRVVSNSWRKERRVVVRGKTGGCPRSMVVRWVAWFWPDCFVGSVVLFVNACMLPCSPSPKHFHVFPTTTLIFKTKSALIYHSYLGIVRSINLCLLVGVNW